MLENAFVNNSDLKGFWESEREGVTEKESGFMILDET